MIDSRIAMSFRDPQINSPAQNKMAQLAVQEKQLDMRTAEQEAQRQGALADLLRTPDAFTPEGGINPAMLPKIAQAAPGQALDFSKAIQGQQKFGMDQQTAKLNQAKAQLDLIGRLVGGVTDEATYQQALQQAQQMGLPINDVPQHYDPAYVTILKNQTLTAQQQIDNAFKERGLTIQQARLDQDMTKGSAPQQSTDGFFKVGNNGQVEFLKNPQTGQPIMPITVDPNNKFAMSEAGARGTEVGKATAQGQLGAPKALADTDLMLSTIDSVMNHQGLNQAVGPYVGALPTLTPDARDFGVQLDQLQGQVFLRAYQDLKGGGAITDFEGSKAENALAAIKRAQSPEQFKAALNNLRSVIVTAQGRLKDQAQGGAQQQQPAQPAAQQKQPGDFSNLWGG